MISCFPFLNEVEIYLSRGIKSSANKKFYGKIKSNYSNGIQLTDLFFINCYLVVLNWFPQRPNWHPWGWVSTLGMEAAAENHISYTTCHLQKPKQRCSIYPTGASIQLMKFIKQILSHFRKYDYKGRECLKQMLVI